MLWPSKPRLRIRHCRLRAAVREKHLCDAIERARQPEYRKHFDGFKEFARGHGLAFLPALPALAAGYLLHLAVHKRAEMDDIRLAYWSITYAHDLAELFMDRTFLDAAMAVITEIGGDGGGGGKVIPLTPMGNRDYFGP